MQAVERFHQIFKLLPPADTALVIAALRQDALVWQGLESSDLLEKALEYIGGEFSNWSPANLSLLSIDSSLSRASLLTEPLTALAPNLQGDALQAFDTLNTTGQLPQGLAGAGLAALALRERFRMSGSWDGLSTTLATQAAQFETGGWRSVLACLYGLVPNSRGLLRTLASFPNSAIASSYACHCILCTPASEDTRVEIILSSLLEVAPDRQIEWLKYLRSHGYSNLATRVAQALSGASQPAFTGLWEKPLAEDVGLSTTPSRALRLQQMATLYQQAGYRPQAVSLLRAAQDILQHCLVDLQIQSAGLAEEEAYTLPSETEMKILQKVVENSPRLQADLILGVGKHLSEEAFQDFIPEMCTHPVYFLQKARRAALRGDLPQAQEIARQGLPYLLASLKDPVDIWSRSAFGFEPADILEEYENLGLLEEARQCVSPLLSWSPSDLALISSSSQILERSGDVARALELANVSVLLSPNHSDARRRLADLYEISGNWENALTEREKVLQLETDPSSSDWLNMARCAFFGGHSDHALNACNRVIEQEPDSGYAHALAGEILLKKNLHEDATRHLSRATLLSPEDPQPWLLLSEIYRMNGGSQRALETLRAAVLAIPESPEIHFAMAKAFLDFGLPSDALPYLWEAFHLSPETPDIAWKLAKTLHELGHTAEARRILEESRQKWPAHPLVAVTDAETLIEAGDLEAAIPALEVALQSEKAEPEWHLLYAKALLNYDPDQMLNSSNLPEPSRLEKVQTSLQELLQNQPAHFEGGVILAEILFHQNSVQEAFDLYSQLVDRNEANHPQWRWRVQAGFGQTALSLNQVETAIAALRESIQAQPENIGLHQVLADAYLKADLKEEAVQTAQQVVQLAPDYLPGLSWFIEIMKRLGREKDTIETLVIATQLAPERADFWNLLAQIQVERGDLAAAHKSLASLRELDVLTMLDLQEAAYTYLRLGEQNEALACMEQAVNTHGDEAAVLLFPVAGLRYQLGKIEEALEAVQNAVIAQPEDIHLYIFQADLLSELKRPQAALACLEHAMRLMESQADKTLTQVFHLPQGWMPVKWYESLRSPGAIYTRFALLLRSNGNLAAALHHAEKALEEAPHDLSLRYLAAELSRALLNPAKALKLAEIPEEISFDEKDSEDFAWRNAIIALQAEMAFEKGEDAQAIFLIQKCLSASPDEPRFQALQARLMVRQGNQHGGLAVYENISQPLKPVTSSSTRNLEYLDIVGGSNLLYVAEAALELERWGEAARNFEQYAVENAQEPRGHVRFARCLVLSAERQRLCQALKSVTHAPGEDTLCSQSADKFERVLAAAARLCNSVEVATWQARGRAVFQPGLQHAPAVAKLPNPSEHSAALLSVLRNAKNAENAIRIAHHYPQSPALLLELALCYHGIDAEKGLEAARSAVEKNPGLPLNHTAQALLAEEAGKQKEALVSIQNALTGWPDEPEWHRWAARLSQELGDVPSSISHWEQCLKIQPESVDTALNLGRLYLNRGQANEAVAVLEKLVALEPKREDAWMLLAQAQRMAGALAEALDSADQASRINPGNAVGHLLSGEIALLMGKSDLALQHAHSSVSIKPDDPAGVLFLSRVLVQKGSLAEGLAVMEKSLPALHSSQPVMLERANLIRRLYGPQVALPVFLELAQIFSQDSTILSILAQTQADCGDFKTAERTAYSAYHLNPDLPQLNYLLGRLQHSAGQLDQAIHFLSEAIRQSPAELEPYLELGQAYLERREHLQALRTYQQAIKVSPRDFRPFFQAAGVLRDSKDYVGAEAMLRRAAELAPEDLNIRRQLGAVVALNLVHNSQEANSNL
jgi:tetratricopeptide (TPR) repeat protein